MLQNKWESGPPQDTKKINEGEIDVNLAGSFPASDPPSWTLGFDPDKPRREQEMRQDPEALNHFLSKSEESWRR